MLTRRLAFIAAILAAACSSRDPGTDTTRIETTGASSAEPSGDPPPPRIDTTGTMFVTGALTAAPGDSAVSLRFSYDTASASTFRATFQGSDSVTVDTNASLTGGADSVSGTGSITARKGGATIVADLSKGIRGGSSLGKCRQNS